MTGVCVLGCDKLPGKPTYTVANLPTTGNRVGDSNVVTDATTPAYNAAVVGGGAVTAKVYWNGTAWTCG